MHGTLKQHGVLVMPPLVLLKKRKKKKMMKSWLLSIFLPNSDKPVILDKDYSRNTVSYQKAV